MILPKDVFMSIPLKYGSAEVLLSLPEAIEPELIRPVPFKRTKTEDAIVEHALKAPIGSSRLEDFVQSTDTLAVIVSDKTRNCRTDFFLPVLLARIEAIGVKDSNIAIVFANGTHALQSEEEKQSIVGSATYKRYKIFENDCYDEQNMAYLGRTRRGTDIWINRLVAESDKIIATGGISHHYFAGFGGGAKLIMPGVASHLTVLQNHKLTLTDSGEFHPGCLDGSLDGNPVYEDIVDAASTFPPVMLFSTILDENGYIIDAVCGDLIKAHRDGARKVESLYRVLVPGKADLVVVSCGGYPKDINFIQAHKSIHRASYVVKEGGVIICLAECLDGIGSKTFLDWFEFETEDDLKKRLLSNYTMNGHTALALRNKLRKARVILVSRLDRGTVEKMGTIHADSAKLALDKAAEFLPVKFRCYVLPNGSLYVPRAVTV
jgi:nickel-dependent lactate racemase